MNVRTTYRLFLAACLLGALIWLAERPFRAGEAQRARAGRVLRMRAEDVIRLALRDDDLSMDCVKRDGVWFLERPLSGRADAGAMTRILSGLEAMAVTDVITPAQREARKLTLADYGLLEPRRRIKVVTTLGRRELLVGHDAPVGRQLYVTLAGTEDVLATSDAILDVMPKTVAELRDRIVLHGDAARTSRIELHRREGAFVRLTRAADGWMLQQPVVARAEDAAVLSLLDALYALKVVQFVWDPPLSSEAGPEPDFESEAHAALYALTPDDASLQMKVWVDRDEVGKALTLGKPVPGGEAVYAKLGERASVYAVPANILRALSVSVNDLRARDLFAVEPGRVTCLRFMEGDAKLVLRRHADVGWQMVEPVQWRADHQVVDDMIDRLAAVRATSFVDVSPTNLATLGLAPAARSVEMTETVEGKETTTRLLIGAAVSGRETVYVKLADGDVVCEVPAGPWAADESRSCTDPLTYRDRTVLAVSPESVSRLTLTGPGGAQSVALAEDGVWHAVAPATNAVHEAVIKDILFFVSNLRALRIECHDPENLGAYGLDRSGIALTVGLTGEEGIQKSIIMGFRARTDGIFAMVQGQDVVFVIETGLAARLARDLMHRGVADEAKP